MSITSDDLRKLLDGATPGPWGCDEPWEGSGETWIGVEHPEVGLVTHATIRSGCAEADELGSMAANARLIALAPALAAEVLRLREMIRRADQVIVWEAYGLGNDFAEQIEAAALEAQQ